MAYYPEMNLKQSPKTFEELIRHAGITLPSAFQRPAWDPIPMLRKWNGEFGPDEGIPHWDGNAVLRDDEVVDLTLLLAEADSGADMALVRVWNSGDISLQFSIRAQSYPLGGVRSGDELRGMLRVLRVLRIPGT